MKAYQITQWGQPLEEREVEIPKPKGTEVLLKVTACGAVSYTHLTLPTTIAV